MENKKENLVLARLLFHYCELVLWFGETVFGNDEHSTFPYYEVFCKYYTLSGDLDPDNKELGMFSFYSWWHNICQSAFNSNWNHSKWCCQCNKCQWKKITDIGETYLEIKAMKA